MPFLFVRHASALRRSQWSKPDHLRPLSPRGETQAMALADELAREGPDRILSSPAVRCIDTVQLLAGRVGLPVEPIAELHEGHGAAAASLLRDLGGSTVVVCTHGDVLPELLDVLTDVDTRAEGFRCEKGSVWIAGHGMPGQYRPPPE